MPVSAATLAKLMAAGLAGEALLAVVASIDADAEAAAPPYAPVDRTSAERQARYRARGGDKIDPILRKQVFDRDDNTCLDCGATADLCADHIVPLSKGGPTTFENLQTLCRACNGRKKDRVRKFAGKQRNSMEFHGIPNAASPSPQESPQTPKETTPSTPTTQQENPLRGQKKASRLPIDWVLPSDWRHDAVEAGLPNVRIDLEADKIRDWSRSSRNGAKLDWRATWRNWCREAAGRLPQARGSPASHAKPAPMDHFMQFASEINGQERDDGSLGGDRHDAPGLPVRAIEHHGR